VLLLHVLVFSKAFIPASNFAGTVVDLSSARPQSATRLHMSEGSSSSSAADFSSNNDGTVEDAPFQQQEKRRFRAKLIAGSAEVGTVRLSTSAHLSVCSSVLKASI
jgi:hypothetical protein